MKGERDIDVRLWYTKFNDVIDVKYEILLVLAALHNDKKISDEKLKGQLKSLRAGTLQKLKKTHHCEITDRWYNEEPAYEVFLDCIERMNVRTIPFKEFIKYVQLFENKGYNYALNIFGSEYLSRMLNYWNPEYHSNFSDYIGFYIPNVSVENNSYTCYECGHTHDNYSKNEEKNRKVISEWLHNMKKGDLKKIPFNLINSSWGFWS